MEFQLRQGGRAASDFLSDLSFMAAPLRQKVDADLEPKLRALQSGPTTLKAYPERPIPDYFRNQPWIRRTSGGWDGHDYPWYVYGRKS
jgi:hypothetical protein